MKFAGLLLLSMLAQKPTTIELCGHIKAVSYETDVYVSIVGDTELRMTFKEPAEVVLKRCWKREDQP